MKTIDIHSHFYPDGIDGLDTRFGKGDWPGFRKISEEKGMITYGDKDYRPIYDACWNAPRRIEEMDKYSVDVQIMCATPILFAYEKPADQALACARLINDEALELCSHDPTRLKAMCQVPLQDIDLARAEASRAMACGHVAVQIGNHVKNKNLDDEGIITFLQHCASIDAPVLIHPWDMMGKSDMEKYWLPWLVGMPAEMSRAACSMIFGGVFERLPHLRVLFSHASGAFLATLGRIEHGFNCRPDLVAVENKINPREYVGKFWVDSITHDERLLKYVLDMQGSNRICMGTDYPFPLGDLKFGQYMEDMGLEKAELEDIKLINAGLLKDQQVACHARNKAENFAEGSGWKKSKIEEFNTYKERCKKCVCGEND